MKTLFLSIFLIFSFASLSAEAATPSAMTTPAVHKTTIQNPRLRDAHIIESVIMVDKNEIKAAQVAIMKSANPNVKRFAQEMISDHTKNLQAAKELAQRIHITPAISAKTNLLNQQGDSALARLKTLSGKQFDVAYMGAMVMGHQAALRAINQKLLPKASNPELKSFLNTTKATVEEHLQKARLIFNQLTVKVKPVRQK